MNKATFDRILRREGLRNQRLLDGLWTDVPPARRAELDEATLLMAVDKSAERQAGQARKN